MTSALPERLPERLTTSVPDRAGVAVVVNPTKLDDGAALRDRITAALATRRLPAPLWLETSEQDPGFGMAEQALARGAGVVMACGGDGTVRAVMTVLAGTGVPLAVLPAGTGNLLARNLQLPLASLDAAVAIAFGGVDRAIDLGVAVLTDMDGEKAEHVFLVMAGLGLDAQMIANTSADLKKQVGWLAYVDAGMRVIPKSKPFRIRYSLEGRTDRPAHVSTILVANCGVLPGNIQFLPDALVDDGILDIAVLQPKGVLGWLTIWRRVTWENGVLRRSAVGRRIIAQSESSNERVMTTLRGSRIRIVLEHPQEFEIDGDEFGPVRAVSLRADPGALTVRMPAPAVA